MTRRTLLLIAVIGMFALPMSAQYIVDVYTYHSVSGTDYAQIAPSMRIKLHNVSTGGDYWGISDPYGHSTISAPSGWYQAFVWDPYYYQWGSTDTPDPNQYYVYATPYQQVINLSAFPRPLAPNLVGPCNYCGVGQGNFDLIWTKSDRATST